MTREDAITLINSAKLMLINPTTNEPVSDLYTALDIAIQALEQEPCDKCEVGNPCLYCKHEFEPSELTQDLNPIIKKGLQKPCEDAISREDVIKLVECSGYDLQFRTDNADMCDDVRKLLSVTPSRHKGRWIAQDIHNCYTNFKCSECGYIHIFFAFIW